MIRLKPVKSLPMRLKLMEITSKINLAIKNCLAIEERVFLAHTLIEPKTVPAKIKLKHVPLVQV